MNPLYNSRRQMAARLNLLCAVLLAPLVSLLALGSAQASIPVPSVQAYSQNFDSLISAGTAAWQNNTTLAGWYAADNNTTITSITAYDNTSTSLSPGLYSFGPTGNNERAIGLVSSNSNTPTRVGVVVKNTSGARIKRVTISYTGEQWLDGNTAPTVERLQFKYKKGATGVVLGAPDIQTSIGFTSYPALNFDSPQNSGSPPRPLNGNDPANSRAISSTIDLSPDLGPNQEMLFVWEKDNVAPGQDDGLAIDNLKIEAGFDVALPTAICPTTVTTFRGSSTSATVSAFDPNGTVTQAQIVSAPVAGITLTNPTPATIPGGIYTATLQIDGSQAVGSYPVAIQFTSQENNETKQCTITVNVLDTLDLGVAKDGPATYKPGSQVSYAITVNPGDGLATNVVLTDTLPTGMSYVSDNSGVTPAQNGQNLVWNLGSLNAQKVIALVTDVLSNTTGTLTNTVKASTTAQDTNLANNTATVATQQYVPVANFANSSKTVNTLTVQTGEVFTYTLAIVNEGDADTTYALTDTLASSLALVSAPGMTPNGQTLTATGPISGGDQLEYTISVKANTTGTVNNSATLSGDGSIHTLTAPDVTVVPPPAAPADFSTSSKTVDKTSARPGDQLVYTITLVNTGQQQGSYSLADPLDSNLVLVSAPGMTLENTTLKASGTLGAGLSQSYVITAKVAQGAATGATISNSAALTSNSQTRALPAPNVTVSAPLPTPADFGTSSKTVDKITARPGDQLVYTIALVNSGQEQGSFSLTDKLDPNLTLVSAPGMSLVSGTLRTSGTVAGGQSQTFVITVRVAQTTPAGSKVSNSATLTSNGQTRTLTAADVSVTRGPLYLPMISK